MCKCIIYMYHRYTWHHKNTQFCPFVTVRQNNSETYNTPCIILKIPWNITIRWDNYITNLFGKLYFHTNFCYFRTIYLGNYISTPNGAEITKAGVEITAAFYFLSYLVRLGKKKKSYFVRPKGFPLQSSSFPSSSI